jgi:hypothetical protein
MWPPTLKVRIPLRRGVLDPTLCDNVCSDLGQVGGFPRFSLRNSWSIVVIDIKLLINISIIYTVSSTSTDYIQLYVCTFAIYVYKTHKVTWYYMSYVVIESIFRALVLKLLWLISSWWNFYRPIIVSTKQIWQVWAFIKIIFRLNAPKGISLPSHGK